MNTRSQETAKGFGGIVTAPHHLATTAGRSVLADGGSAAEAAVAMAAVLAVVYPHMNGIGGDSFWLLGTPGGSPIGIDACGRSAAKADLDLYKRAGLATVPHRGPLAANTMAGTISGWAEVLRLGGGRFSLDRLLEPAITYAERGFAVTESQAEATMLKRGELEPVEGFARVFLNGRASPAQGDMLKQPALAGTLRLLVKDGLASFYRGALAKLLSADLEAAGSPLRLDDFADHSAALVTPLVTSIRSGLLFNMPPPTQGVASLMILALFDRLGVRATDGFDHVHGLVEATKAAFKIRDRYVGDPDLMTVHMQDLLDDSLGLNRLAATIDRNRATPWPTPPAAGDTVWFGAIDAEGHSVSAIQSIYFEFGSGLVLPQTGVAWQNRGASFRLDPRSPQSLGPRRKPFHTLNPAMAMLADGRHMVYGTMGGEGQPQTQAAIFTRYALFGQDLQASVSAPRWLLGKTWGEDSVALRLEHGFDDQLVAQLRQAGHPVEITAPLNSLMGHAGALVRWPDGSLEGASDPRSDGAALPVNL